MPFRRSNEMREEKNLTISIKTKNSSIRVHCSPFAYCVGTIRGRGKWSEMARCKTNFVFNGLNCIYFMFKYVAAASEWRNKPPPEAPNNDNNKKENQFSNRIGIRRIFFMCPQCGNWVGQSQTKASFHWFSITENYIIKVYAKRKLVFPVAYGVYALHLDWVGLHSSRNGIAMHIGAQRGCI